MWVLGIDPGLTNTGWAVINKKKNDALTLCDYGTILPRATTNNGKLHEIFTSLNGVLDRFSLTCAAIENVFINKNPRSSMSLCYARSAAIIALMNHKTPIFEYQPTVVKKRVFGSGHADKAQVAFVVNSTLRLPPETKHTLHETDAISIALCHIYSNSVQNFCLE